jgi:hypothetical protein
MKLNSKNNLILKDGIEKKKRLSCWGVKLKEKYIQLKMDKK